MRAGADINAVGQFDGETALMSAAQYGDNPEIITLLLGEGANAKLKNNDGATALNFAKGNSKLADTIAYPQLQEASK